MISGETPGAGEILYFAGLEWILRYGIKDAHGLLASDTVISSKAAKSRIRFQNNYSDYIYTYQHPDFNNTKINDRNTKRPASEYEAAMWRLKMLPPYEFVYTDKSLNEDEFGDLNDRDTFGQEQVKIVGEV
jgi:hypothetical protein